ncbi:hypothetical protein [Streptomyces chartreusis]
MAASQRRSVSHWRDWRSVTRRSMSVLGSSAMTGGLAAELGEGREPRHIPLWRDVAAGQEGLQLPLVGGDGVAINECGLRC